MLAVIFLVANVIEVDGQNGPNPQNDDNGDDIYGDSEGARALGEGGKVWVSTGRHP